MKIRTLALAALLVVGTSFGSNVVAHEAITPAFAHAIPNVPGKTLTALVVTYQPGGTSLAHRHGSAFVVAYVLSGAIRADGFIRGALAGMPDLMRADPDLQLGGNIRHGLYDTECLIERDEGLL